MKIYIASSWKNRHAVEMLTTLLRQRGHEVLSFVENNHGELNKSIPFDEWVDSEKGQQSFEYDTAGAMEADLVVYISPSGTDAWAEVGAAWAVGVPIIGLYAKGEPSGLMRKMATWSKDYISVLKCIEMMEVASKDKA